MRFDRTAPAVIAVRRALLVVMVVGAVTSLTGCGGAGPKKADAMPAADMQKYNDMMKSGPKSSMPGGGTTMPGGPGGYPGAPGGMGGAPHR